jgi:Fe-S-cluster-containing dehydrogenase component
MVCSFEHFQKFAPTLSAVSVFDFEKDVVTVPVMCLQCDEASCVKICPTGAMRHNAAGVAVIDYGKCIVCKLCMQACPFGNISYSLAEKKVFKCDLCGGDPKCVRNCAAGALLFEDSDDSGSRRRTVANLLKESAALVEEVA